MLVGSSRRAGSALQGPTQSQRRETSAQQLVVAVRRLFAHHHKIRLEWRSRQGLIQDVSLKASFRPHPGVLSRCIINCVGVLFLQTFFNTLVGVVH